MRSNWSGPVNIGSDEMVTINNLVSMVASVAEKTISINHIDGPIGVKGRNSDNRLFEKKLNWRVSEPLIKGLTRTYKWIESQAIG